MAMMSLVVWGLWANGAYCAVRCAWIARAAALSLRVQPEGQRHSPRQVLAAVTYGVMASADIDLAVRQRVSVDAVILLGIAVFLITAQLVSGTCGCHRPATGSPRV